MKGGASTKNIEISNNIVSMSGHYGFERNITENTKPQG